MRPEFATEVVVAPGRLIWDQLLKRQVSTGERVLIHPAQVDSWVRNGWVRFPDTADAASPDAEPELKTSRRSRKNVV